MHAPNGSCMIALRMVDLHDMTVPDYSNKFFQTEQPAEKSALIAELIGIDDIYTAYSGFRRL